MSNVNNIPDGWVETTLGELIDVKHGFAFRGIDISEIPNENILVTPGNFSLGGGFKSEKFKYYYGEIPESYILKPEDIIVSMTDLSKEGDTLGYSALVPKENKRYLHNQRIGLVVFNNDEFNKQFAYWLLRTRHYQKSMVNSSTGSTVRHTSPSRIQEYEFNLPPLPEQKAIAAILTAFDDKIENLQAQNKTLEQTAQTIFKEWFGKYQVGDDLPEGWSVGKLGDISKLKSGYAFKSKNFIEDSNFKALKIKDLKGAGNVSISDISSIDEECTKTERVQYFKLKEGDIVLAMSGNTTGKIGIVPPHVDEIYLNQRVGKFFIYDENLKSFLYNFLMSCNYESKILSMGYGSAQPNISPSQIEEIDIILPNDEMLRKYLNVSIPIYNKVLANAQQIQTLKKTRDTLLPKLMSGDIRVKV